MSTTVPIFFKAAAPQRKADFPLKLSLSYAQTVEAHPNRRVEPDCLGYQHPVCILHRHAIGFVRQVANSREREPTGPVCPFEQESLHGVCDRGGRDRGPIADALLSSILKIRSTICVQEIQFKLESAVLSVEPAGVVGGWGRTSSPARR